MKTVQYDLSRLDSQASINAVGHSLVFADEINGNYDSASTTYFIQVTSGVESESISGAVVIADDSQSETAYDITSGKFVRGNVIAVLCPLDEARTDLRDFTTYKTGLTNDLHIGVCSTTQSQDYTPNIVANGRPILMMTPEQISSLK